VATDVADNDFVFSFIPVEVDGHTLTIVASATESEMFAHRNEFAVVVEFIVSAIFRACCKTDIGTVGITEA